MILVRHHGRLVEMNLMQHSVEMEVDVLRLDERKSWALQPDEQTIREKIPRK